MVVELWGLDLTLEGVPECRCCVMPGMDLMGSLGLRVMAWLTGFLYSNLMVWILLAIKCQLDYEDCCCSAVKTTYSDDLIGMVVITELAVYHF
ncbi:hypothetical protein Dimus_031344 [Dionaea muscipula]